MKKILFFFHLLRRYGFHRFMAKGVTILKYEGWNGVITRLNRNQELTTDYARWIQLYDVISEEKRQKMISIIRDMPSWPTISIIMPTYNSRPEWLLDCIRSVQRQVYPHWELCIADDASTDPRIKPLLQKLASDDKRIKVVFRDTNGHISAASNSALKIASGEWIALLDHDDLLAEHALFHVAQTIHTNPHARLIYSDEDKLDHAGRRHNPYFKCDWNLDLFYSHNMFSHLGVFHKPLLDKIDGFRVGIEGSQDYDLALRCIEYVSPDEIIHIPHVLYHWRMHEESTASGDKAKPYAILAGQRALNEHFQRRNIRCNVEITPYGYRSRYALPDTLPLVSLIIPTRNACDLVRTCITSILEKTVYANYEIILVDNGSDDQKALDYFAWLDTMPNIRVLRDNRPFNYSALNNAAVAIAKGEVVGLINNDIEVISPEWLCEMVSHALRPEIGAVGANLFYPDDTVQHAGVLLLGLEWIAGHSHKHFPKGSSGYFGRAALISSFSAVTGACLVIRKSVYEEVGGLDEENLKIAFNDVDFCIRLKEAGYRNLWTPYAQLYHHETATRGAEDTPEKKQRFDSEVSYMRKNWGHLFACDPAYSPNLALACEDFSLAWPPRVDVL